MPTAKSIAEVEELKTLLSEAKLIISTDYRGLSVIQLSALRRAIGEGGGQFRVAKNTLVKIASDAIEQPQISEIVMGPTGLVLSNDDQVAPARALMTHIEQNRLEITVNGAYLDGRVVDANQVKYLASLPGREELLARLLGQMNAPIAGLVTVLSGTIRGLVTVLQAHIDNVGSGAAPEASAALAVVAVDDAPAEESPESPTEPAADAGEVAADQAEKPVAEAVETAPPEESATKPAAEVAAATDQAKETAAEAVEDAPVDQQADDSAEGPASEPETDTAGDVTAEATVEDGPTEEADEEKPAG
ncbi:MAG: 50S ribosomal protein L10 [Chloroflexi bacterium]|nr:50S ribosomal protein L10 [Chloroflexota bacterium]